MIYGHFNGFTIVLQGGKVLVYQSGDRDAVLYRSDSIGDAKRWISMKTKKRKRNSAVSPADQKRAAARRRRATKKLPVNVLKNYERAMGGKLSPAALAQLTKEWRRNNPAGSAGGWLKATAVRFLRDGRGKVTGVEYRKPGAKKRAPARKKR